MSTTKKSQPQSSCQSCTIKGCKVVVFLLQLLFTVVYAVVVHRAYFGPQMPVSKPQGKILGPLKFLTIWDIHFQLLISVLNVLALSTNRFVSLRNAVHHGLSLPFGISVAALFWSIYIVDRRLVFPVELDALIPPVINHILHTMVGITPIINELTIYNQRKSTHIWVYLLVLIGYLTTLLVLGYYLDFWVYPIFEVLNHLGRFVFIGFSIGLGLLIYLTHGALHSFIWNKQIKDSKKKRI